ncbi:MAG: MOSC domain-containing protein [Dehalococcoidia bacterium]
MAIRVTALNVYPVKSCAGLAVSEGVVDRRGFEGDREYMVVDPNGLFVTQREVPRLALVALEFVNSGLSFRAPGINPLPLSATDDGSRRRVVVWRSQCEAVDQGDVAAEWLSGFLGVPVRLVRMADDFSRKVDSDYALRPEDETGFSDGYPFLLLGEASLADLNSRLSVPVDMRRFRPNIVVSGAPPYAEDGWRRIRIGEVEFGVVKPCARCVITTTDQDTAERGREPLATLATYRNVPGRGVLFGQNLIHMGRGQMRVGDAVEVLETA